MTLVIGVAPGADCTGIVLRQDDTLRRHQLVDRSNTPFDWYLKDVVDAVTQVKDTARNIVLQDTPNALGTPAVLAIGDWWERQFVGSREALEEALEERIQTAQVIGAIAGHWITIRITAALSRQPLTFYPDRLQSSTSKPLRAAWDVAGYAIAREEATA